jgi:hypothetical protein
VLFRPAAAQTSFREACGRGGENEVTAAALANPALALRQMELLAPLPFGARVLERLALAAPDEAAGLSHQSAELRHALEAGSPQMRELAAIAEDKEHDAVTRRRAAPLAEAIARSGMTRDYAWKLASGPEARYFAALADRHESAAGDEAGLDRALEAESLTLCRAAQEHAGAALGGLAALRPTDVYLALAYGGGECAIAFPDAFDRLLAPRLKLAPMLARTGNWKLREFTAEALEAGRFPKLVAMAGTDALAKLALGIVEANDAVLAAEMAASGNAALNRLLAVNVAGEYERARRAQDRNGEILYGLLAARLVRAKAEAPGLKEYGAAYKALLDSSGSLDTEALFDGQRRCVERYFFWDDDDGVQSFENFLHGYERDPAWQIERVPAYVHLTGHGAGGRSIEIFANIPIDIRRPENREREGEAQRRQAVIAATLAQRGLATPFLVHRGHSFHVEKTLGYVMPDARLVVLGSCRGVGEIHHVIEVAHDAEVIATRGTGAMAINDSILKALNMRLLSGGGEIRWAEFWRGQLARTGRSATLQSYVTPDRDEAATFLRAYYQALNPGR